MAQQDGGWPLGLQPLNVRVGLVRNRDTNGSVSFNTLLTGSPTSSTDSSSSDLDTESTGSFFHDRSITLGTLLGVSNILKLSRRSTRGRRITTTAETSKDNKKIKPKTWLFSLCSKLSTDAVTINNNNNNNENNIMAQSLGHFLETERRAATIYRRNQSPNLYGPDDLSDTNTNALFVNDHVAPPPPPCSSSSSCSAGLKNGHGNESPLLLACLCAHVAN